MFLPFRQVALVFALGASLIALPLESACAAEAAGKKSGFSTDKGGIDCCEGAHSSDKECQIQTGVSEKGFY
ncbi:MAG: hypothetical protein ACLT49_06635 [Sutterella wadsworthensis]